MTVKDRIHLLAKEKSLSIPKLEEHLGLGNGTISRWSKSSPSGDKLLLLAEFFGVSVDYLLGKSEYRTPWEEYDAKLGSENLERLRREVATLESEELEIPIYGRVAAGEGGFAENHIEGYITVNKANFMNGEYFALTVTGDSMYPDMKEGDLLIIKKTQIPVNRKICVMLVNGDEATVKEVLVSPDGITLVAYNRDVYEPHFYSNKDINELPVICVGVVAEIRRYML